jgi:tetratricopeptide (TPR) repeat protein
MAGERVRIAVQLVNVENGYHLWSETYDRRMDDIFAIQDDIAQSVVAELREIILREGSDLTGREKVADEVAEAIKGRAADPEAQRLMLLGRYLLDRFNQDDVTSAVRYFREALDIDPDYAQCWSELGRAYAIASGHGWTALDNNFQLAIEAMHTALDLDPDLAEAHARLGLIRWQSDVDALVSEQCLQRALDLRPDNINVLIPAATVAGNLGQFEKALTYCRRAAAIDPLSPRSWANAPPAETTTTAIATIKPFISSAPSGLRQTKGAARTGGVLLEWFE